MDFIKEMLKLKRNDKSGAMNLADKLRAENELNGERIQILAKLQDDPEAFIKDLDISEEKGSKK